MGNSTSTATGNGSRPISRSSCRMIAMTRLPDIAQLLLCHRLVPAAGQLEKHRFEAGVDDFQRAEVLGPLPEPFDDLGGHGIRVSRVHTQDRPVSFDPIRQRARAYS